MLPTLIIHLIPKSQLQSTLQLYAARSSRVNSTSSDTPYSCR